jgi:hypothetical protein
MNYDDDLSPLPAVAGGQDDGPVPSLSADEQAKVTQAAQVQQQIAQQQAFQAIPDDVLKFIVKFHQAGASIVSKPRSGGHRLAPEQLGSGRGCLVLSLLVLPD